MRYEVTQDTVMQIILKEVRELKKSLALIFVLIVGSVFAGCNQTEKLDVETLEPELHSEPQSPKEEQPEVIPENKETDTVIKTPDQEKLDPAQKVLLESQLEEFDMMYRYTGESSTFEPSGWGLTITLPEEWKEEAILLCTHPNDEEYHTIQITSNTLMKAYQEETGRKEDCSWYDYVVQFIGVPTERTWEIELYQDMISMGYVYDAGVCNDYHYYILINQAQGNDPDDQVEPIRDELKEVIGEEAYRAMIDALECNVEIARSMISFTS